MRRAFLIGATVVALCAAGVAYAALVMRGRSERAGAQAVESLVPMHLERVGSGRLRSFVFSALVRPRAEKPQARVAVHYDGDEQFYAVELSWESTQLWRVQCGVSMPIGRAGPSLWNGEKEHRLEVQRHAERIAVFGDGRLLAEAYDGSFYEGVVAVGSYADSAEFVQSRVQRTADIVFSDDFMRSASDESDWAVKSGAWSVKSLDNPALSINAFYYEGRAGRDGRPALAVVGYPFWSEYRFTAACRPQGEDAFGLAFYYRSSQDYWLFRLSQEKAELVRQRGEESAVVVSTKASFAPAQWYQLAVSVSGRRVQCFVDGHEVLSHVSDELCGGQVGLYAEGLAGTRFDDVVVRDERDVKEQFDCEPLVRWVMLGGSWRADGSAVRVQSDLPAKLLTGQATWRNYRVASRVNLPAESDVGLVVRHLDERNFYLFVLTEGGRRRQLVRVQDGMAKVLRESVAQGPVIGSQDIAFEVENGFLVGRVNGQAVVEALDRALPSGRVGLFAAPRGGERVSRAVFGPVEVTHLLPPEPVQSVHDVFAAERSMSGWSSAKSDWEEVARGEHTGYRWHQADFFTGERAEFQVEPPIAEKGELSVVVAVEEQEPQTGYEIRITAGQPVRCTLLRRGRIVATATVDGAVDRLTVARRHGMIHVEQHERTILQYDDPEALSGTRLGYRSDRVSPDQVVISSPDVLDYTFERAPTDWRVGAGKWEVSSRWACDPRWSWFAGDGRPLAVLWNKHRLAGDQRIEGYVAIQMDNTRGGSNYAYARDINLALCADGRDLNSGYAFIYGGDKNTATRLIRKGRVVAEDRNVRIPRDIHRRWFHVRAEKKGSRVAFYIDGRRIVSYDDPEPLEAPYAAVWTYEVGLMVARVRVSAERLEGLEPPWPVVPPTTRSPYGEAPVEETSERGERLRR